MKLKHIAITSILLLSLPALAGVDCKTLKGQTLGASVVKVADGDTATVKLNKKGSRVSVRFYGADTPESEWKGKWPEQPHASKSKQFTISKLKNKKVTVAFTGDGTFSRCVGEIFVNGKSHSEALIKNGHAWWYSKYAPNRQDLRQAQITAQRANKGLWESPNPIAPWTYRHNS